MKKKPEKVVEFEELYGLGDEEPHKVVKKVDTSKCLMMKS